MLDDLRRTLTDRYDREARAYRELWAPVLRQAGLVLLREFCGFRAQRIIDVGTGVGTLLPELTMAFPEALVLGVDRARGMLAMAPPGTPLAAMDAAQLGVAPASVDLVLLVFMLFHLERPLDALREARRVLRHPGRVGTLTWAGELESKAIRIWSECLDGHGATPIDPATQIRHDRVDAPHKMDGLLGEAGFACARSWIGDLIFPIDLEHLIRLRTSLGSSRPRFDSLEIPARDACLAEARLKMERLGPEDFVARGKVVYSVASV